MQQQNTPYTADWLKTLKHTLSLTTGDSSSSPFIYNEIYLNTQYNIYLPDYEEDMSRSKTIIMMFFRNISKKDNLLIVWMVLSMSEGYNLGSSEDWFT